jgi:hypothetical protein
MRHVLGVILAGGVLLGQGSFSKAQVNLSVGNPNTGPGVMIGQPNAGYGSGYGNTVGYYGANAYGMNPTAAYGTTGYPSNVYGMPASTSYYSSGYQGYAVPSTYANTGYYGTGYTAPVYGNNRYVIPTYGSRYVYGRRGLFGMRRMRMRRMY